jgi:hypothetical protein
VGSGTLPDILIVQDIVYGKHLALWRPNVRSSTSLFRQRFLKGDPWASGDFMVNSALPERAAEKLIN